MLGHYPLIPGLVVGDVRLHIVLMMVTTTYHPIHQDFQEDGTSWVGTEIVVHPSMPLYLFRTDHLAYHLRHPVYHAIIEIAWIMKFMAIPNYTYLVLKMTVEKANLKQLYNYDKEDYNLAKSQMVRNQNKVVCGTKTRHDSVAH